MISLEQVQLLETRVARAIEYVQRVTERNTALVSEKTALLHKLEANKKRLDELEMLIIRFKEDQGRIEDGIIAALDRLSQFEEAFEDSLKEKTAPKKTASKKPLLPAKLPAHEKEPASSNSKEFFEISDTDDLNDPEEEIDEELSGSQEPEDGESNDGELDIF